MFPREPDLAGAAVDAVRRRPLRLVALEEASVEHGSSVVCSHQRKNKASEKRGGAIGTGEAARKGAT